MVKLTEPVSFEGRNLHVNTHPGINNIIHRQQANALHKISQLHDVLMQRKRKLPARAARAESFSKKRVLTLPESEILTHKSGLSSTDSTKRIALPTSITPGKPLPTVTETQLNNLSLREYQSVSESGILLESLHRSRQKWTSEGIFEKYWTKVRKGKNAPGEPLGNPPKDSMTKLGTCTITIEPHLFDATLYAVKDSTTRPKISNQTATTRPTLQYGPSGGIIPLSQQESISQSHSEQNQNSPDPGNSIPKPVTIDQCTSAPSTNSFSISLSTSYLVSTEPDTLLVDSKTSFPAEGNSVIKNADPVIQMLAQRAATDPDLQYLMEKVANGQATPGQLRKFQEHIDEVTCLQQGRQAQSCLSNNNSCLTPPSNSFPVSASPKAHPHSSIFLKSPAKSPCTTGLLTQNLNNSTSVNYKGSIPSSKSDISGVVLEFINGNGDRYSFPKYSILEFVPCSNQVIISFLIIRKGSAAESQSYDPELDYYQPITIRLYAHQARQLEALQKAVESIETVRRWMNKVMDECQRAEFVLLAMRLPREIDHTPSIEEEDCKSKINQPKMLVNWATTRSSVTSKSKSTKKSVKEDEHYINYINSIAAIP